MGDLELKSLGINIHNLSMVECIKIIDSWTQQNKTKLIFTTNTDHLKLMQHHPSFLQVYHSADLRIPDGMPLIWLSKLLTPKLKERVAGVDLVFNLCKLAHLKNHKVMFIGGPQKNVDIAKKKLTHLFPNLQLQTHCPTYNINKEENKEIINIINKTAPDILLVGFGAPKQELWLTKHKLLLNTKVCLGVGGSFDLISGCKKRAPKLLQKAGLEWLFRISQDRTLTKRYLADFFFLFKFTFKELFIK